MYELNIPVCLSSSSCRGQRSPDGRTRPCRRRPQVPPTICKLSILYQSPKKYFKFTLQHLYDFQQSSFVKSSMLKCMSNVIKLNHTIYDSRNIVNCYVIYIYSFIFCLNTAFIIIRKNIQSN